MSENSNVQLNTSNKHFNGVSPESKLFPDTGGAGFGEILW